MSRLSAALGSAVFLAIAPGVMAGLVPWLLTGWDSADPPLPVAVLGGVLVVLGAGVLLHAFGRFVVEGRGTPAPVAPTERLVVGGLPYVMPYTVGVRKTSVYLDEELTARLVRLAREEGRSQADILRAALAAYEPEPSGDRDFALSAGFARVDDDSRPISQIPEAELLEGFGG